MALGMWLMRRGGDKGPRRSSAIYGGAHPPRVQSAVLPQFNSHLNSCSAQRSSAQLKLAAGIKLGILRVTFTLELIVVMDIVIDFIGPNIGEPHPDIADCS